MTTDPQNPDAAEDSPGGDGGDDFLVFLAQSAPGSLDELNVGLSDVISAVRETGKPGRLTYVVEVAPAKGVDGMVLVKDAVQVKTPKADRDAVGMFYVHDGGVLAEYPPGQQPLFPTGPRTITGGQQ